MNNCIICGGTEKLISEKAEFAPWIKNCILSSKNNDVSIIQCLNCASMYYSYRYKDEEIEKIYKNYRSEEYAYSRNTFEPGYLEINKMLGGKQEVEKRKKNLSNILKKIGATDHIDSILDFGGDDGSFIPDEFSNAEKFVYDISNSKPIKSVTKLKNIGDMKFDLVMCCHTLEHVNHPFELFLDLKKYVKPNGYIYIELPFDMSFRHFKSLAYRSSKRFYNLSHPAMHEHINYFTTKSMQMMSSRANLRQVYNKLHKIDLDWHDCQVISSVFQLSENKKSYKEQSLMQLVMIMRARKALDKMRKKIKKIMNSSHPLKKQKKTKDTHSFYPLVLL